tara:strand:- start:348 stop:755 length:408 start_codon:yes stop_codon:yes gene_type:complete
MNNILLIIVVLMLMLIFLKQYEHFELTNLDTTELLDSVHRSSKKTSVNVVGKELDDEMITKFIKDDSEYEAPTLEYPEERPEEVSEASSMEDIEKAKMDYEHLIELKTQKQNIKLNGLLNELKKISLLESKLKCD